MGPLAVPDPEQVGGEARDGEVGLVADRGAVDVGGVHQLVGAAQAQREDPAGGQVAC